jgi:hypothetical protein
MLRRQEGPCNRSMLSGSTPETTLCPKRLTRKLSSVWLRNCLGSCGLTTAYIGHCQTLQCRTVEILG